MNKYINIIYEPDLCLVRVGAAQVLEAGAAADRSGVHVPARGRHADTLPHARRRPVYDTWPMLAHADLC